MNLSEDYLSQVTVGIRFEKMFRVSDIIGSLFDIVLHDPSTPFGTDFFPKFHEFGPHDRMLYSLEHGRSLRINISDIIFQYTFSSPISRQEELNWFKQDALRFLIEKVLVSNGISNIHRFGYMMTHICEPANIAGRILDVLTDGEEQTADQFTLRFGKKDASFEGQIRSGVNDYVNMITTLKQISPTHYDMTYDYQYYFNPNRRSIDDWNLNAFFRGAENSLKDRFYPQVNRLIGDLVEA